MTDLETRKFALGLGVQIVHHGQWTNAQHRADYAIKLAEQFVAWLDPPPEAHPQADQKREAA